MAKGYSKDVDYTKLVELASNYNIVELAKGKIKGKGTGALRNLETRLRVVSSLAPKSKFAELDKAYDVLAEKKESYYWQKVMKQPNRELDKYVSMATIALQNELVSYSTKNKDPIISSSHKGQSSNRFVKTIATVATIGLVIVGAMGIGYNIRDKSAKDEIAKAKNQTQIVYVEKDKQTSEQEKVESPIISVKPTLEEKVVEAKAESKKTEDKEIWGNAGSNYRKDIPEYSPERLKKKLERDKRHAPITAKVKRNLNQVGDGVWKVVSSPLKFAYNVLTMHPKEAAKNVVDMPIGAIETIGGGLGTINGIGEGITRGAAYTITNNDSFDNGLGHFWDASIGGNFNKDFHSDFIKFWEWGQKYGFLSDIKNNPCKSSIAIMEDALLIWGLSNLGHGGEDDGVVSGGSTGTPFNHTGGGGTP